MTYNAAEVYCHLGFGFGHVAEAQMGMLWEETAIVVPPQPQPQPPTREYGGSRSTGLSPGGAAPLWAPPRDLVLDDAALRELARETAELSQRPELRTWVSSVLSQAGRRDRDLSTETAVAQAILSEVQPMTALPLVKTAHLGAGLLAVGLHVTLAAHGQVFLDKTLVAVHVDGAWRYADPHGAFDLGETVPFKLEKFVPIPDLAPPEPKTEVRTRARVTWQTQAVQATRVEAPPSEIDLLMQETMRGILASLEPRTPPAPAWKPIHTVVVVGALGIAALALWQLYEVKKEAQVPARRARPRRTSAARGRR